MVKNSYQPERTFSLSDQLIKKIMPLGFNWETSDPFLFCAHHNDHYPAGNANAGPNASLTGRALGYDFTLQNGWRMYHGTRVPGFPVHPHRGFETVTIVLNGFVDHSDSHGAAGRYGNGDVQWMTAGSGLQHAEMFPLLNQDKDNPLELFQVWLNLPREKKFADPYYAMFWAEDIPCAHIFDSNNKKVSVKIIAGQLGESKAIQPGPDSWAFDPDNDVSIWLINLEAGASWTLPAATAEVNRSLYFYRGDSLRIADTDIKPYHFAQLQGDMDALVENGDGGESYLLLLQGRPIKEPVAQHGPFVMNTTEEIRQAIEDYQQTQFGGWPWPDPEQVHPLDKRRFARYADGREEDK